MRAEVTWACGPGWRSVDSVPGTARMKQLESGSHVQHETGSHVPFERWLWLLYECGL